MARPPCWRHCGRRSRRCRASRRAPWPTPSGIRCAHCSARKASWGFRRCWCCSTRWAMRLRLSLYSTFMIKGVGFSLHELSIAGKVNMTVSTMIGVAFGGWVYMRWGTFRSLLIFGIGQALTNLLYMWLALAGKKVWLLVLATSLDTRSAAWVRRRSSPSWCRCAPRISAPPSTHCCRRSRPCRATCTGCDRGHSWSPVIGWAEFLRGHLPDRRAGADFAGDPARAR